MEEIREVGRDRERRMEIMVLWIEFREAWMVV